MRSEPIVLDTVIVTGTVAVGTVVAVGFELGPTGLLLLLLQPQMQVPTTKIARNLFITPPKVLDTRRPVYKNF
jgi:hypothetical protein